MTTGSPFPFLQAEWRHLAMLNFEVEPSVLRPSVPNGTELDSWNGRTYVSDVGFLSERPDNELRTRPAQAWEPRR